jgi:type II secretory pathway component PulJ
MAVFREDPARARARASRQANPASVRELLFSTSEPKSDNPTMQATRERELSPDYQLARDRALEAGIRRARRPEQRRQHEQARRWRPWKRRPPRTSTIARDHTQPD